LTAYSRTYR